MPQPTHPAGASDPGSLLRSALASGEPSLLRDLVTAVGGVDALEQLHEQPWPDEPVDWAGTTRADRPRIEAVVERIRERTRYVFDDEYCAIATMLARRVAVVCPLVFRKGDVNRTAAALAWLAVRGNADGRRRLGVAATDLWTYFGVTPCADRGRSFAQGLALTPPPPPAWRCPLDDRCDVWLADPSLLHSSTRRSLCRLRDHALAAVARERENAPIRDVGDGRLQVRARPLVPQWSTRGTTDAGRSVVCVGFDDGDAVPFLLGLSVPDARHLVRLLGDALDAPCHVRR